MIKADIYNTSGIKSTTKISLPKEIFGAKINQPLMAQAIRVYLANQRQGGAKTKSRGEVRATGRKVWAQKGSGRARHGDRKAPIFVKGGRAHGPTGEENYKLKISKKMKRKALFSALTYKLKENELMFVKGLEKIKPKTKEMAQILQNLKLKSQKSKVAIVMNKKNENIIRAGNNIAQLRLLRAQNLNTYQVLNSGKLIFMEDCVEALEKIFLNK
jgi:large subunit ribosomal protein L4